MNIFAKLFESNGFQVLVKKAVSETSDGPRPKVSIILQPPCGGEVDIGIKVDELGEAAVAKRDKIFNHIDQQMIDGITQRLSPDMDKEELEAVLFS
ncbi:hypothetical protein [Pseudoalteromonas rubra]|uniref:hypothetical protein n=1 Tax=Pseudoalteromonas rubra TaxID=43658 RepID=UPI002DB9CD1F|nr:hypothetical protein [Pseudoalteromonas rubra]MEC4091826.1 hypothetical protein [Pseudoalteromonas rubra]